MDTHITQAIAAGSCVGQAVNPDISGIGVRLSFYIQNFLLVILVDRSWQDAPGALWTFIFTSLALTIAAIVQAAQQQLSLLQALTIGNLVWTANFGTFLSMASYSRRKACAKKSENNRGRKRSIRTSVSKVQYFATLQTFFSMALTLYVWANADTFGNQDDCAPFVKYVAFFGVDFAALKAGKILGLTMTSFLLFLYVLITVHESREHMVRIKRARIRHDAENPESQSPEQDTRLVPELVITPPSRRQTAEDEMQMTMPKPAHAPLSRLSAVYFAPPNSSQSSQTDVSSTRTSPTHRDRRPKPHRPGDVWARVDPMFLSLSVIHVVVLVYFILTTELLLHRNPAVDNSASQWGFGQIFAMIAIVPSLVSVIGAFHEHGVKRLHYHTQGTTSRDRSPGRRRREESS